MRLKRVKRARKIVSFFKSAHGFKPPYDVLLDGTAIQAALNQSVILADALPKVLGDKVRLLVPKPVVAELHKLGRDFSEAAKFARRLKILTTSEASTNAAEAIMELVDNGNAQRRFVMTEDMELRRQLTNLNSVPILRFARQQIVVELPGGRAAATEALAAPPPPAQGSSTSADAAQGEAAEGESRKRKRIKEPNPLSCKKKKKPSLPTDQQQAQSGHDVVPSGKKSRRGRGGRRSSSGDRLGQDVATDADNGGG